jgi:hypothetical protein
MTSGKERSIEEEIVLKVHAMIKNNGKKYASYFC